MRSWFTGLARRKEQRCRDWDRPVAPSDCACLMTLPLNREEFDADWSSPNKDFLASNFSRLGREAAWAKYSSTAREVSRLCNGLEKLSVHVYRRATLEHLAEATRCFPAIALVAHFYSPPVTEDELPDPSALQTACRQAESPAAAEIANYLIRNRRELAEQAGFWNPSDATDTDLYEPWALAAALNGLINEAQAWYSRPRPAVADEGGWAEPSCSMLDQGIEEPAAYWARIALRLHRVNLEEALGPSLLRPGRALEMSEGKCTIPDVVGAIPQEFTGVLDLTTCNSVIPGEAIRRHRKTCLALVGKYPTPILSGLLFYTLCLEYLNHCFSSVRPITYTEAFEHVQSEAVRSRRERSAFTSPPV
jgi:hypothetical protein